MDFVFEEFESKPFKMLAVKVTEEIVPGIASHLQAVRYGVVVDGNTNSKEAYFKLRNEDAQHIIRVEIGGWLVRVPAHMTDTLAEKEHPYYAGISEKEYQKFMDPNNYIPRETYLREFPPYDR